MKKGIILIAFLLIWISACNCSPAKGQKGNSNVMYIIHDSDIGFGINVITIDGCEYIVYNGSQKGGVIHKENCKNHR